MEQIRTELTGLKLRGMAHCLKTLEETRKVYEVSFVDGLKLLLQAERDQRTDNRYQRLIRNAGFRYQVSIEELSFNQAEGWSKHISSSWLQAVISRKERAF